MQNLDVKDTIQKIKKTKSEIKEKEEVIHFPKQKKIYNYL